MGIIIVPIFVFSSLGLIMLFICWHEFNECGTVTLTYKQFLAFYVVDKYKWTCTSNTCQFNKNGRVFSVRLKTMFDYARYMNFIRTKRKNRIERRNLQITNDFLDEMRNTIQKQADEADRKVKKAMKESAEIVGRTLKNEFSFTDY